MQIEVPFSLLCSSEFIYCHEYFVYFEFTIQLKSRTVFVGEPRVCITISLTDCSMLCLQLAVQGLDSPASARPRRQRTTWGKPCNEKMTALALTCISADSERCLHVCLFPSALNSPLTPFKSWFVWVTSANLHRHSEKTSCKAVSFKSAYFHLISHQYEMGSYEKTQFMVHWVGVFKKNTLIRRCTPLNSLWCQASSRSLQPYVGRPSLSMFAWKDTQFKANVYIYSCWVFVFSLGAFVPHADSKPRDSHGVEMQQLFVCVKGWRERGFFMVWVQCESCFTSCSTLLQVN